MKRRRKNPKKLLRAAILLILIIAVIVLAILALSPKDRQNATITPDPAATPDLNDSNIDTQPTEPPEPTPTPEYFETPYATDTSQPASFGYKSDIEVDGTVVKSFQRANPIYFGKGSEYTAVDGIVTFRGDNYRSGGSYGTATVSAKKLKELWSVPTGSMSKGDGGTGSWTGSGWVGQPLIVRWPKSTKNIMNMYDWAKEKDDLVEVILATMDGNVYFLDLETGEATRDKLKIGMPFKGAGALDPRGYPILYLGSGDSYSEDAKKTRAMAYSLIDFTRLYEFGKKTDSFALRSWHAYDSSPLVDAETDTLIYPGENGILYTVQLNTQYDEAAGTLTMNPSNMVKYRYTAKRIGTGSKEHWLGYEDSAVIWGEYAYLSDNGGLMQCINLNTMEIVWVQDTYDDTNGSPVLEEDPENHTAYLYIGTSLRATQDANAEGITPLFKIDAVTGEVIWKHEKKVSTVSGVSGGIQATPIVGQHSISDLVIIPFARTPKSSIGELVAIDKATGEERWSFTTNHYSWSSPVAVYDEAGNAYIIQCDTAGNIYLLDGKTGELLDRLNFEANNFEASPAVYGNTIVVGTRAQKIYGITIE